MESQVGWEGRGAASARINPAASNLLPPHPHPAQRDQGELEMSRRRDLEGMLDAGGVRGEGEFLKRQEGYLGNRQTRSRAVSVPIKRQMWASCSCLALTSATVLGLVRVCVTSPQALHVQPPGTSAVPTGLVSKVVLVLYLGVDHVTGQSVHLFL